MRITFIAGGLFALLAFTTAATAAEIEGDDLRRLFRPPTTS